jgi:hypothetical protein
MAALESDLKLAYICCMSWATRITLIIGVPWAIFVLMLWWGTVTPDVGIILGAEQLLLGLSPLGVVWVMLRLALGNRGAVRKGE